ncbi:MAG: trigger factor [Bacteroidales bacterium]|jgi:trigger factor
MNITKEKASDISCTIKIEIIKEDYETNVQKELKKMAKNAQMPGFRVGKVPMSLINKKFRSTVLVENINQLVSENLNNYIETNNIKVLGSPVPNDELQEQIDFDNMENFAFYFDLALFPELDFELDNKLSVPFYEIEVDDEMVNKYLEDLKVRLGETIEPETIELTDYVYGTFVELDADGNVLNDGITSKATIAMDMIKLVTIQRKFEGKKVGDVVVFDPLRAFKNEKEVAHMLGTDAEIVKNMKSEFNFTIEKITRRIPAELNEETFKKVYPQDNISSIAELEDKVRQDAKVSFNSETERKYFNDSIDKFVETIKFDLAEDILKKWMISANQDKENSKEEIENQFDQIIKNVRWQVIESYLIEKYNIDITHKDIEDHLIGLFLGNAQGIPEAEERAKEFVTQFLSNPENQNQIKSVFDHILEQRLISLFKEKTEPETKEVSYKDFIKIISETK